MSLEWARCLDIFLSIKWGGFGPGDWRGWRSSEQWLLLTCLSILSSCSSGLTHFSFKNKFFSSILFLFGYFYALGIPWQLYSEKVLQDAQTNKRMFACGLESLLAAGQSKQWKSDALIFVGNPGQSWAILNKCKLRNAVPRHPCPDLLKSCNHRLLHASPNHRPWIAIGFAPSPSVRLQRNPLPGWQSGNLAI